jgi:hypothetical protein
VVGLCTRVAAKMASHALRCLLRQAYGIDVQTFRVAVCFCQAKRGSPQL